MEHPGNIRLPIEQIGLTCDDIGCQLTVVRYQLSAKRNRTLDTIIKTQKTHNRKSIIDKNNVYGTNYQHSNNGRNGG
jgi:hypothetical protein